MSEESAVRPAVLIVSPPDDPHTAVVMRMLRDRHVPCACVDATDVGDRRVIVDIPRARLLLAAPDVDVDLTGVETVWLRRPEKDPDQLQLACDERGMRLEHRNHRVLVIASEHGVHLLQHRLVNDCKR